MFASLYPAILYCDLYYYYYYLYNVYVYTLTYLSKIHSTVTTTSVLSLILTTCYHINIYRCLTLNLPNNEQTCAVLFFVSFCHSSFSHHRFDVLALVDPLPASPSPFRYSVSLSLHPCDTNDVTRAIPSDATPRYLHGRLFVPACPPLYRFPFARLSR